MVFQVRLVFCIDVQLHLSRHTLLNNPTLNLQPNHEQDLANHPFSPRVKSQFAWGPKRLVIAIPSVSFRLRVVLPVSCEKAPPKTYDPIRLRFLIHRVYNFHYAQDQNTVIFCPRTFHGCPSQNPFESGFPLILCIQMEI